MYKKGTKEREQLDQTLDRYNTQVEEIPVVIGSEELQSARRETQVKPFDHKNAVAKYYQADETLLNKAIDAGLKAFRAWDATPPEERVQVFVRAAELIRGKYRYDMLAATMLGQAKTTFQAEIDCVCELSDFYAFNAQWALESKEWQPISVGSVTNKLVWRGLEGFWAAVAPFNFTAISGNLAGTVAMMGNVVLWKPSHSAVLSSYLTFKILREAGLPPGVINFVPSRGPDFGNAITKSPHLVGVNFTGSCGTFDNLWNEVGKNLPTYRSYPRLVGETGGKNFHFVHPSADFEHAVNSTIRSAFEYSGQKCSACSRLYVAESMWPAFRDRLVDELARLKVGSPRDPTAFMSAVIDARSFKKIKGYIDEVKTNSELSLVTGGHCDDSVGYFIQPTVIQSTNPRSKLMLEEIFGPVMTVYVYKDNEVHQTLNVVDTTSPFGLTGAIFAQDQNFLQEAQQVLRFSAGNLYINDKSTGAVVSQQPFGGARKSGTNDKAGSPYYIQRFANLQAVKLQTEMLKTWTYDD
jgi:1-pyrroline-5-carboxylate dehydrogenase